MSGISGFRPIEAGDYTTDGEPEAQTAAGGETATPEALVQRGGTPALADTFANMDASVLQARLEASGLDESAAAEQTEEIQATAAEMSELEAELAELYELEEVYEELLNDPELDPWYASWLESDLWDVRLEIYDLEWELGKLEGNFEELVGGAWTSLLSSISGTIDVLKIEGQRLADTGTYFDRLRQLSEQQKEIQQKLQRQREDMLRVLAEKGLVIPLPPRSEQAKKLVAELETKLEAAKDRRDDAALEDLQEMRRKIAQAGIKAGKPQE
jgi:hypothetical protein